VHTLTAIQPNKLQIGDNIVVCDAGGGTVDLISYKITKLKPLQVVESAQGEGGLCGGFFVNLRFEAHVKARLGVERFETFKSEKPKAWRVAQDFFEDRVKRWYGATSMNTFEVPFPGFPDDEAAGIEDCFLILTSEQVKKIFDPVIQDVIVLVEHQVEVLRNACEKVTAILCVGGFGQSAYLQKCLEVHFQTDLPPAYSTEESTESASDPVEDSENESIKVMVPTDCWTACVRGALQRGLQDSIVMARKCRFHYGIVHSAPYHEDIHPASSRFWDEVKEEFRANGLMRWYLEKGETIEKNRVITFGFSINWSKHPLSGDDAVSYSTTLYASAAPAQALMQSDASVFQVCTLRADLRAIPRRQFRKCSTASGKKYYSLGFQLVMKVNSADIEFSMEIDDEPYGSVTASFDHSALAPSFDLDDD